MPIKLKESFTVAEAALELGISVSCLRHRMIKANIRRKFGHSCWIRRSDFAVLTTVNHVGRPKGRQSLPVATVEPIYEPVSDSQA